MALGSDFKHAQRLGMIPPTTDNAPEVRDEPVEKWRPKGPRRVRTMRGAKIFGQPIGTIITRDMVERARRTGKLKAAGEAAYGHYAPAKAPAPARAARAAAKPARAGARAASKVSAPKAPSRPKGGRGVSDAEFKATLQRASYKDVRAMIADLQNDDHIDDKTFDTRLNALLARGRQLRPNKDHGTPPAKREAKAPPKPAAQGAGATAMADWQSRIDRASTPAHRIAVENSIKRSTSLSPQQKKTLLDAVANKPAAKAPEPPARPQSAMDDPQVKAKVKEFDDALEGVQNEAELNLVERYLGKEKLPVREAARLRVAIKTKRATLSKPKQEPKQPEAPKESADQAFMRLRSDITRFQNAAASGGRPERIKAEADRLKLEVDGHPALSIGMKDLLYEQIKEATKAPKAKRSPRYDHFADEIVQARTKHELAVVTQDIRDDFTLPKDEVAALVQHVLQQAKDLGIDQSTLTNPGAALNPNEWDSHPDKVKATKSPLTPKMSAYTRQGRKELAQRAEEIRSAERWANPDATPAGKEILAGKQLDEIKNPEGLVEFISAHPERFTKTWTEAGQGGAFSVRDKEKGREFFFKHTNAGSRLGSHGSNVMMFGEAVNEVVSGKIGQAFPNWFPNVDFAGAMESGANPTIRMDHLHEIAKRMGDVKTVGFDSSSRWDENMNGDKVLAKNARKVRDPKNPLAIHIFDYLTNSTDRHDENYGEMVHNDGTVTLVALDNGAAFHGFDSFIGKMLPKHFLDSPESVGYAEFAVTFTSGDEWYVGTSRGKFMAREVIAGYNAHGGDAKTIQKDADAIIKRFSEMNPEQIKAELLRRFPDMQNYERAHLESAAHIFQTRLKNITGRDVATFITKFQKADEGY